ncbi:MAG: shikimate kinase [Roseiflexaceae bacterium]|nr:shikimate kinase [Roseiflexaceae bacterium]
MAMRGIYLVGFSGTGKSTVAQLVGAQLGWSAYDLDGMITEQSGLSVPALFEREGEAGFRARETAALRSLAGAAPFVLATGGGAVIAAENRQLMAANGWLVALEARPELLLARMQRQLALATPDAARPLLSTDDPLERIRVLKAARQPFYDLADWTLHTDLLSPQQVADEIVRAFGLLNDPPRS